ncbi:MAG: hypothetical protein AAGF11_44000 [Myxococcota bacterium]
MSVVLAWLAVTLVSTTAQAAWLPRRAAMPQRPQLTPAPAPAPAPDMVTLGRTGNQGRWSTAFWSDDSDNPAPPPPTSTQTLPPEDEISTAPQPPPTDRSWSTGGLPSAGIAVPSAGAALRSAPLGSRSPGPLGSLGPPGSSLPSWSAVFGAPAPRVPATPSLSPQPPLGPPVLSFGALHYALAPTAGPDPTAPVATETTGEPQDTRTRPGAPVLQSKRGVPPFWFQRDYDTHRTSAFGLPPLYIHRTPKPGHPERFLHANLALTFGWYSERTSRRNWINPAGLFYGYFSERKTVWGAVPLLMGYVRTGEKFNFGQFPLAWWWGTKFVKNLLIVPFHYQQRAPESFRAVSGLIAWYGNKDLHDADLTNDRRYLIVAPAFWRFQRGLRRFDISPVYVGGVNKLKGLRHMSVLPLFHWQSREFGNRKELWTLPWIQRSDEARGRQSWAVPLALTFRHRTRDRDLLSATPLVWRARNELRGSELWLAGIFGRYRDPQQRNTVVAPLWWRFHDVGTQKTTSVLAPLALARRGPGELRVYTLLGGGGRTPDGWRMAVPPLLTVAGRTDRGVRYQGIAGLFWHVRQPPREAGRRGRDDWVLGPLAYVGRDAEGGRLGVIPALSFVQWGGTRRYQVITPLVWHVRNTDPARQARTVVAGPFYHHSRQVAGGRQFDGGVAPLLFYGRGDRFRYGVVPWLLLADVTEVQPSAQQSRRLTLSPLFVRSKGPDHRTLGVGLLGWDVVRGSDERHSVLFPLYYRRRRGNRALTLTPLGGRRAVGDDITSVWGLYFRRRRPRHDTRGMLPLVFVDAHEVDGGTARHVVAAPLFLRRRTPSDDLDMWSPLVWRSTVRGDKPRRGLAAVPFYFRQRQPGGVDVDAGLGFFWSRDATRRTHTVVAGPAFHRLSRKRLNAGVVPLYWWMDSETKRRLLALPVTVHVVDKSRRSHTTISVPLWFDRKQANGRRTWGAFPFVFGGRRLGRFSRFSLAPPGYVDFFRLRRNTRFTGYIPLLFRYQKCGFRLEDQDDCRYTLWGSAPLFLYGRDGRGRRTHGSLVYYWDRRPEGYRLYTPLFGITNEPGKTLGWYAGIVGVRTTNTWRRSFVFPLWFRRTHRLEKRGLTLAVPPLYIARHNKDRRFFEAGLLVWQFRQPHKVATAVVPPLFFHSHAFAERRVTWLAPLFLRDDHWAKDEAWTAIGPALYVQRRKGENLDFVQFPLVWHIERGPAQGTFGAFVWWDIRTKRQKMLQLVPVAFTRWATPERDIKVIGPGLGWWVKGRGATEGDRHWRALFGLFGGGVEAGQRYISVFGARIPRGAAVRTDPASDPATDPASDPATDASADGSTSRRARRQWRRAQRRTRRATRVTRRPKPKRSGPIAAQ